MGAPQDEKPIILIVKQSQNHDTEKQEYSFSYETENGISVSESGVQKQIETSPKKPEPCPRVNSPTPKAPSPTPSPGWPMRTDSRPPVTTCPLPLPCPSTSSRCSLT